MINGCFLNQALFSVHKENFIHFSISNNMTTVSTVTLLIGSNFKKKGDFDSDAICKFDFFSNPNDTAPTLQLNQTDNYFAATLYLQIQCHKNTTDTEFHQVATIELDVTANFTLDLQENYMLFLNISDLNLYPA